ncbi:16S rRNA (guanine(527)-N(7))-methyltransferase RsmG [Desulforudis sp. 1088]|uniref:16S rRNA (guanine(527)-N(7))-methyltransferase RsmG n=1 Tax=unclassified Candidatus Desulforudis TaxID=2635950 RepID=UPI003CE5884C
MSNGFCDTLVNGLKEWNIAYDDRRLEHFVRYHRLVMEKNREFNLTSITEETESAVKHFLDSLSLLLFARPEPGARVIDVGTGAGFPGVALKIAVPSIVLTLLDSSRKKVAFLEEALAVLELDQAAAVWGRAEELGRQPRHRERYDWVLARGVAEVRVLAEYCLPFAAVGGCFVAYKGPGVKAELAGAQRVLDVLGGSVEAVHELSLPFGGGARSLAVIRKIKATPERFPRRPGMPEKRPL